LQGVEFTFYQLPANIAIIPAILILALFGVNEFVAPMDSTSSQLNNFTILFVLLITVI